MSEQQHVMIPVQEKSGLRDGQYWVMECSCGWGVHSGRHNSDVRWQQIFDDHVADVTTDLEVGEEVLLPAMDVVRVAEFDGERWLTLKVWNEDLQIDVPARWCNRVGPVPGRKV